MPSSTRKISIPQFVAILGVVIIVAVVLTTHEDKTTRPATSPAPTLEDFSLEPDPSIDMSDWVKYTNTLGGYSLKRDPDVFFGELSAFESRDLAKARAILIGDPTEETIQPKLEIDFFGDLDCDPTDNKIDSIEEIANKTHRAQIEANQEPVVSALTSVGGSDARIYAFRTILRTPDFCRASTAISEFPSVVGFFSTSKGNFRIRIFGSHNTANNVLSTLRAVQ